MIKKIMPENRRKHMIPFQKRGSFVKRRLRSGAASIHTPPAERRGRRPLQVQLLCRILALVFMAFILFILSGCSAEKPASSFSELKITGSVELKYARQFSADYLEGGFSLITISESGRFLIIPPNAAPPAGIDADITLLYQPTENIYLAATSAMCLFDALGALENIAMSGTKAEGWHIENARAAMENGGIVYAGKYSAPDYETLIAKNCGLAIESTMINQVPEVKEKLEALGIPVLTERSSYEEHPLGRTEWIKLYGLLTGKEIQADELFDKQAAYLDAISQEHTGKTVAFFYVSSSGNFVVRRNGDYVTKMIELAGGEYIFESLGDGVQTGSVNLEAERFYKEAKDADIIIYNSSIDGEVKTIEELTQKSHLIADFKAVKSGDVWRTGKNLFQETTEFGQVISDFHRIFTDDINDADELSFLYKLT